MLRIYPAPPAGTPIVAREHVTLDSQFAVHRYLRLAEKTTVGFHWEW
jgi:hypothetical protein